jgi:hypothetical protein
MRWIIRLAIVLFLMGSFLPELGASSLTQTAPASQPSEEPIKVRTGLYLLNVGRLDTITATFSADFYLSLECDKPCDPSHFEFVNGRASQVDNQGDTPTRKDYRILGNYYTAINLKSYPFDSHQLDIILEDRGLTQDKLVYQPEPRFNGIDPKVIVSGWELVGWNTKVSTHYYPIFDETYSRYEFFITIRRGVLEAVLKALLPAIFIVVGGFLGFLLGPDKTLQRLTINTGALTGAILFHVNLTSQVPPVGALTYADKFMIINYVGLVGALLSTVFMMIFEEESKVAIAEKLHRRTRFTIPALWLALQIAVAFTI